MQRGLWERFEGALSPLGPLAGGLAGVARAALWGGFFDEFSSNLLGGAFSFIGFGSMSYGLHERVLLGALGRHNNVKIMTLGRTCQVGGKIFLGKEKEKPTQG